LEVSPTLFKRSPSQPTKESSPLQQEKQQKETVRGKKTKKTDESATTRSAPAVIDPRSLTSNKEASASTPSHQTDEQPSASVAAREETTEETVPSVQTKTNN